MILKGDIFCPWIGAFVILMKLSLSLNSLHLIIGTGLPRSSLNAIFLTRFIMGIKYRRHIDNTEYSDSFNDLAILVCSLLHQVIGRPKIHDIYPARENRFSMYSFFSLFHPFAKSESAKPKNSLLKSTIASVPTCFVSIRYFTILFTSFS